MRPNNTGVTTDLSYADEALEELAAADHIAEEIETLRGASERSRNALIADRNNETGVAFKRADVLSNLAIAEALDRLTAAVERWHEVARPVAHGTFLRQIEDGDPHR